MDTGFGANGPAGRTDGDVTLEAARLWQSAAPAIRASLGADVVRSWIDPLVVLGANETHVRLGAPNPVAAGRVRVELLPRLQKIWLGVDSAGRRLVVEQRVAGAGKAGARADGRSDSRADNFGAKGAGAASAGRSEAAAVSGGAQVVELRPRALGVITRTNGQRTFATFATGPENRVATAIARRVAESRPTGELVCLCGPHGIGKTHLLEAIVHRAGEAQPDLAVRMVTAGDFIEAFTSAIRAQTLPAFKEAVRSATVLLIDDIHVIIGKPATQSELFQTIQAVMARGGTVVVTADAAPDSLPGLSPRERSILAGGFLAQLREPDFAQRRAIAALKAAAFGAEHPQFVLSDEALDLVAARVHGTGRDVEGVVKMVFAATALVGQEASMEQVQRILSEDAPAALPPGRAPTVEQIKRRLAACYNLTVEDLTGQCRRRNVARPRQLAMYLARKIANRSFPDIGARFGGRDHTTVIHAVRKVEELMLAEPAYAREVQDVTRRLLNPDQPKPQ
jgi:chromosomal replication initiator protein